jgi:hypothetical protein
MCFFNIKLSQCTSSRNEMVNQTIPQKVLPTNLEVLAFGKRFNQSIQPGVLPETLQSLQFGAFFNQSIQVGVFPANLRQLTLGYFFDRPLEATLLPTTLNYLTVGTYFDPAVFSTLTLLIPALQVHRDLTNPFVQHWHPVHGLHVNWRSEQSY